MAIENNKIMRQVQKKKNSNQQINLEQVDVREVLDDLNIDYRESGKNVGNDWVGTHCPFCSDQGYHCGISLKSPVFTCFKCGVKGNLLKYLSEELKSFNNALKILGDAVPRELRLYQSSEKINAINVDLPTTAIRTPSKVQFNYLKKRKFDPDYLIEKYNLHFCNDDPEWGDRIIVPIMRGYKLLTFSSIDIADDSRLRYRHLKDELSVICIKHLLYGIEFTNGHSVLVTEGLFDRYRGDDGVVNTFGTKVTAEQRLLLSKFSRVGILFDGDKAGREAAEVLANDLAPFTEVIVHDLPDGVDPDNLTDKQFQKIKDS
jgi:DNA primase